MRASATSATSATARKRRRCIEVVRDNLETLYGAIDDGAIDGGEPRGASAS
jgi:hypothetical protein